MIQFVNKSQRVSQGRPPRHFDFNGNSFLSFNPLRFVISFSFFFFAGVDLLQKVERETNLSNLIEKENKTVEIPSGPIRGLTLPQ